MSRKEMLALTEICFVVFVTVLALAVFISSLSLPVSLREPLGSSTMPQIVCGIVILFCIILLIRSLRLVVHERRMRASKHHAGEGGFSTAGGAPASDMAAGTPEDPGTATSLPPRGKTAIAIFLLAIAYAAVLETRQIPAYLLTPVILFMSIYALNDFRRASIIPTLIIAAVVGTSVPIIFTDFFNVNLP